MSSRIWTPAALSRERRRLTGVCWRIVESQFRASTMKLVATLEEQALLESLIEAAKPPLPGDCRHLHYLLSTPFRYGAPYPTGSRFRRAGPTAGVFYASETVETAITEMAFHRLLFFADSPDTPWPSSAGGYTAFSASFRTEAGLDLSSTPFDRERARWTHATDYSSTQDVADRAREAGMEVLRYRSARDADGTNIAILICAAFRSVSPLERQTWRIDLNAFGVRAICEFPDARLEFNRGTFASDPRIARLRWERPRA
jgi:hypothetical protein